jgi:hypothetical protein
MMDNGTEADIAAITQNIDEAEVVCLYFPVLGKTLLIDNRATPFVGPMVRVVPMAESSQDRLRSLRRLRPELPRPGWLTFIPWQRRVDSLERLGVWDHVTSRLDEHTDAAYYRSLAESCLGELQSLERQEFACAIAGRDYRTLWPRPTHA